MNEFEIEQNLSRFKLKDAPTTARTRILAAAHAAWNEAPSTPSFWTAWRWPAYYAAAAALLLLLNGIYSTWDSVQTAKLLLPVVAEQSMDPELKEFYAELGRDPALYRKLGLLARMAGSDERFIESWKQRQELMRLAKDGC